MCNTVYIRRCDECHAKNRPVQGTKKWQFFGLQNCVKFVLFEVLHIFCIKTTRNLTIFHEIAPLFDIPNSISTMTGYVQPCFES